MLLQSKLNASVCYKSARQHRTKATQTAHFCLLSFRSLPLLHSISLHFKYLVATADASSRKIMMRYLIRIHIIVVRNKYISSKIQDIVQEFSRSQSQCKQLLQFLFYLRGEIKYKTCISIHLLVKSREKQARTLCCRGPNGNGEMASFSFC